MSTVLWNLICHLAQWHVKAFRTSGTSVIIQGSSVTSRMTLWHAGILLAHLACWHCRQTHGTGRLMMIHHSLNLEDSDDTDRWCGQFTEWLKMLMYGDSMLIHFLSQSRQWTSPHSEKLAQPHKPKNKP